MEQQLSGKDNAKATANDEHSDLVNETLLNSSQTDNLAEIADGFVSKKPSLEEIAERLVEVFNRSPYIAHSGMTFYYENGEMVGKIQLNQNLIGNVAFQILHGGVAATILDSIGGLVGMFEIYRRNQGTFDEQTRKVSRLATVDLRIDYLAPGRGKEFIATAEVIRMGRKGHTARMLLTNQEGKPIAVGIASYAF